MQKYNSIQEIKSRFNIQEKNTDDIRKCLISLLAKHHPDKNGGTTREIFHEINDAIEYIDNQKNENGSNQLVPIVSEMTSLMKTIIESSTIAQKNQEKEISIHRRMEDSLREYRSVFKFPAIASSSIFAILSAMFLFPTTIEKHPVLGNMFNPTDHLFATIWFVFLMTTCMLWLVKLQQEKSFKKKISFLKSERGRLELFQRFIYELEYFNDIDDYKGNYLFPNKKMDIDGKRFFKKPDFIYALEHFIGHKRGLYSDRLFLMTHDVDYEILESIADLTLAKALERKVIISVDNTDLIDVYEVKEDYLRKEK